MRTLSEGRKQKLTRALLLCAPLRGTMCSLCFWLMSSIPSILQARVLVTCSPSLARLDPLWHGNPNSDPDVSDWVAATAKAGVFVTSLPLPYCAQSGIGDLLVGPVLPRGELTMRRQFEFGSKMRVHIQLQIKHEDEEQLNSKS